MRALLLLAAFAAGPSAAAVQWTPLGPQPTTHTSSGDANGRVTAMAVDPHDDNTVYLGGSVGGVWKTTDGGKTWTPLTDFLPSLSIGAIAISPANSSAIYVGTGEATFVAGNYSGAGLMVSTDKGATWISRPGPFAGARGAYSPCAGGTFISELAAHPANAGTVLAAVRFGSCTSPWQIGATPSLDGIYRSTDFGATWTLVLSGAPGTSVLFDPGNGNLAYAALSNPTNMTNLSAAAVWKSTDAGVTWSKHSNGLPIGNYKFGRTKLAIAASNSSLLYASVTNTAGGYLLGLYRTTDGGATWSNVANPPDYCMAACDDHLALSIHPRNPNILYIGGTTTYRSNDGAGTWTPVWIWYVNGTDYATHPDLHALAFTASGSRLYMGNDGGAWSTTDHTGANAVWNSLNSGLSLAQFYSVAVHPTNAAVAFAGSQDNSVQMFKNQAWGGAVCGDGGATALDPLGNVYAVCLVSDTEIYKSTDGGVTFKAAQNGIPNDYFQTYRSALQFYFPLVMDPSNTGRLYFGTYQVFQSLDGAATWKAISPDLTSGGNYSLAAIAVAPSAPGTIYAGTLDGRVQVTTGALGSGTPSWSLRNQGLPARPVKGIAIDPANAANAWVVYSGYSGFLNGDTAGHVFRTGNSGQTWTDVSGNLPNIPANTIVADPDRSGTIYIGTDVGVFWSTAGGTTWGQLSTALPRSPVMALALHRPSRMLWAATYGRGMWQLNVPVSLALGGAFTAEGLVNAASFQYAAVAPDEWVSIFGAQLGSSTTIASTLATSLAGTSVRVTDSSGQAQMALMYVVAPGQVNCLLPPNLAPGPALVTLVKPDGTETTATMRVEPTLPGIFSANSSGKGVAAAFYTHAAAAGTVTTQPIFTCSASGCTATALDLGGASDQGVLQLYGTGLRHYTGAVTATIGGVQAEVAYAGAGGGYAGLDQINLNVPRQMVGKGEVPIVILVDGKPANTVTAAFR